MSQQMYMNHKMMSIRACKYLYLSLIQISLMGWHWHCKLSVSWDHNSVCKQVLPHVYLLKLWHGRHSAQFIIR